MKSVPACSSKSPHGFVFCVLERSGLVLLENELALCITVAYPLTPGHSLVILWQHASYGLALHQQDWNSVLELLKRRRKKTGGILVT